MKHLGMVIILLVVLICTGCSGGASTPDTGVEQDRQAVVSDETQDQITDSSGQVPDGSVSSVNQPSVEPGVDLNQPACDSETGANDGTGYRPGHGGSGYPGAGQNGAPAAANSIDKSSGVPENKVSLWVTRDFAQRQLHGGDVVFNPGDSVMDIIKQNLEVKTEYGGGFVESINDLSSGYTGADKKTRDWFYYTNGIITSVGALDYKPAPGDVIWWDYHDWGGAVFTPALIGAFPEPFVSGYRGQNPGTVVLAARGCEQQGNKLAEQIRNLGAQNVTVQPYEEKLVTNNNQITLVIGLWQQFDGERFWQGVQKQRKKTGLFIEFTPDYFATLDQNGEIVDRYRQNVGAITATGSGMGDPTPVWLVTGLDQAGLDEAVNVFTTNPGSFKQYFGAVVTGGKVIAVPTGSGLS